ncbi:Caspase-like domain superfamily [Sesbania bispinosa]|nr:Caspase-like domain superfamily [Sesbania bispinosa]
MEGHNKRLAVLVGCNYPNTSHELHGCINDVLAMRDTLVKRFGFNPTNIQLLTDEPGSSSAMPTGVNIKKALASMVEQAEAGDVLYFHYSGHGTRIPSKKPAHPFRHEEAIVPCDFNLITDLDFRQLVKPATKGSLMRGILLSGCQADETSADMNPNMAGGKAYGAFSNAVQMVLKDNPGQLSNREVVMKARNILQAQGIVQHPCLYCSDENANCYLLVAMSELRLM